MRYISTCIGFFGSVLITNPVKVYSSAADISTVLIIGTPLLNNGAHYEFLPKKNKAGA